ncbi:MAG: hypothetical protein F4201_02990 [Nitrospira sp. SB0677_bin_15]|nr:hypothetical protein [Nitrospira sp. SB0677_bin_15]
MGNSDNTEAGRVDFHYIKSNDFRTIFCDAIWGGVTPRNYITMSVCSERFPIPQKTTHQVQENGALGGEDLSKRETRRGIVREVGVAVVMDLGMARSMVEWLEEHIRSIENPQRQESIVENGQ